MFSTVPWGARRRAVRPSCGLSGGPRLEREELWHFPGRRRRRRCRFWPSRYRPRFCGRPARLPPIPHGDSGQCNWAADCKCEVRTYHAPGHPAHIPANVSLPRYGSRRIDGPRDLARSTANKATNHPIQPRRRRLAMRVSGGVEKKSLDLKVETTKFPPSTVKQPIWAP